MIWGSQYDAILNWAKNGTDKDKITNTSFGNNSSGSVTTAGNSNYLNDSINNIRDLGGNLREWTLEAYNNGRRVSHGGYYADSTSPSYRVDLSPSDIFANVGSRLTLYIK